MSDTRTVIGIDPGKSGGLAVMSGDIVAAIKIPETETDLLGLIKGWSGARDQPVVAFVERVNAGPKMGSSAAFKFGRCVGHIHMACLSAGVRLEYVSPQKWQKELGLIVKGRGLGQDDTAKKNRNKARCQELFPGLKITHAICDALLIAEYGRRTLCQLDTPVTKNES